MQQKDSKDAGQQVMSENVLNCQPFTLPEHFIRDTMRLLFKQPQLFFLLIPQTFLCYISFL